MDIPTSNIAAHMGTLEDYAAACCVLLEIGSEHGTGSTWAFRRGIERNPHALAWVTVDIKDQVPTLLRPAFPFWSFVLGDSRAVKTRDAVLAHLAGWRPDLVFIDTDHTYEVLKAELALWAPVVTDGCTWLFHDTHMNGHYNRMTDAIKELAAEDPRWTYRQLSETCNGLGALLPTHTKGPMSPEGQT